MRHATEFGIGFCARLNVVDGNPVHGMKAMRLFRKHGLRGDTRACDGKRIVNAEYERRGVIFSMFLPSMVPSCPKCAVLRDQALIDLAVPRGVGSPVTAEDVETTVQRQSRHLARALTPGVR